MSDWRPARLEDPPRIGDYGLLSNCQGAALVNHMGSIDFACIPAFDSPAVFTQLLGADAGRWSIAPPAVTASRRAYVEDTMVLRTELRTATGVVAVTDFLPLHPEDHHNEIGQRNLGSIMRVLEGVEGQVEVDVEISPRPEFGLTTPLLRQVDGGYVTRGGATGFVVSSPVPLLVGEGSLRAGLDVAAGDRYAFAMQVADAWDEPPATLSEADITTALGETIEGWRSWAAKLTGYDGQYRDLMRRSALVLRSLAYAPTGAIIAAPTTSLPESLGGTRNWDYRYCWVRDASFTVRALIASGCTHEAMELFSFFTTAAAGSLASGHELQILYRINGRRFVPESDLVHLDGFLDSKPVRVGNGAWDQTQLDIFGELLDAAWAIAEDGGTFDDDEVVFLAEVAEHAALRWTEADDGIWEVRGGPRHFLYSKLMCWVALDRGSRLAERFGAQEYATRWQTERDRIREAILTEAWSERCGAFAQSFGADELDASALQLEITGFLPATDDRMRATIEATARELTDDNGFVYRYRSYDGLPGEEGTFGICTFWLAQCLADLGEVERARALFERMAACANDLGLLAEEFDPRTGEALGNFPQAFTHIGLINAALAIDRAEKLRE